MRAEILTLLEESIGANLHEFGSDSSLVSKVETTKGKIGEVDFIYIKNFCTSKTIIKKVKHL